MNKLSSILVASIVIVTSCKDIGDEASDIAFDVNKNVRIIGHKGSGPIHAHSTHNWHENGLPSILNALKKTDGTEVDLQLSKDSTLWLFHDHMIKDCRGELVNFSTCSDSSLNSINQCHFDNQLITLCEFDSILEDYNQKTISLDLKVLSNPTILDIWTQDDAVKYVFNQIQSSLSINDYKIEIPKKIPVEFASQFTNKPIYTVVYDIESFDHLNDQEFVSMPFDIKLKSDLDVEKKQLWTPNSLSDMLKTLEQSPEIIQTDNIALAEFLINIRNGNSIRCDTSIQINQTSNKNEYIPLIELQSTPKMSCVFELKIGEYEKQSEQYLVVAVDNESGENFYWKSVALADTHPFLFLHKDYFKGRNTKFAVYIWNKEGKELNINAELLLSYQ